MTAINLFSQKASAFMLTDGALTDFDGVLVAIENKVLGLPAQSMAICTTGWSSNDPDADAPWGMSNTRKIRDLEAVGMQRDTPHREALALLPALLERMHDHNRRAFAAMPDAEERSSVLMTVAAWDPSDGVAKTYVAGTEPMSSAHPPYALIRTHLYLTSPCHSVSPNTVLAQIGKCQDDICSSVDFDPRRDGLRLLNVQRSFKGGGIAAGYHSIGGRAYLTEVSDKGVTIEEFHEWREDRIGEKIIPT